MLSTPLILILKDHFFHLMSIFPPQVTLISGAWKFHALKQVDPTDPQTRPRVGTHPREPLGALGLVP